MDTNLITAMSGVLGSLVGGSATVATAWITQKTLTRRELNVRDMRQREKLYGEFIGECARLLIDAFTHTLEDPEKLLPLYALTNRVRLTASQPVLAEAERLLKPHHRAVFLAQPDGRGHARSSPARTRPIPLKTFGEACRVELKSIRARAVIEPSADADKIPTERRRFADDSRHPFPYAHSHVEPSHRQHPIPPICVYSPRRSRSRWRAVPHPC